MRSGRRKKKKTLTPTLSREGRRGSSEWGEVSALFFVIPAEAGIHSAQRG
jgi:hypothetical protein